MKKQFQAILITFILMLCCSTTKAFDGNRKGFVLSGGVETTDISISGNKSSFYPGNHDRYIFGFSLGYAFNDKNILSYNRRLIYIYTNRKFSLFQTVGLSWSYYFSSQKKSFFSKIGIKNNSNTYLIGGGYMFSNNIQIELIYNQVYEFNNADRIRLYISYVAF